MRIRRRNPCFFQIQDELAPDLAALLRGEAKIDTTVGINLLCPITGDMIALENREAAFISMLSADRWHCLGELYPTTSLNHDQIVGLAERGAVICDSDNPRAISLREGEARLASVGWHPHAALYHASTRWHAVRGDEGQRDHDEAAHRDRIEAQMKAHGPPPPHFHCRDDAISRHALSPVAFDDPFARVLRARRTTRHFLAGATLSSAAFARVLYGTFGVMGTDQLAPGVVALKRTSASGGALHPVEAYPLVLNVEGLEPGFYHYEGATHTLALIAALTESDARDEAAALTIGQSYFAEASALVFHIARLDRHHWKYRRHPKAYKAVLLDSGHLSQTFYLLAAEQKLGAFYTAAINDTDVGSRVGLDHLSEIALAANGIGVPDPSRDQLHLHPEPYDSFEPAIASRVQNP